MAYCAYITRLKNVRKHSNADRLLCGECFGNNVIVNLDYADNQLGVYFPVDGKLGEEYATKNNLLRKKDENGNNIGGYLDPEKRNIKALKLRGEKSDGLFMPLESLADYVDISTLKEGETITVLNGILICDKYIPKSNHRNHSPSHKQGKKKENKITYPYFEEHIDTAQLCYNLDSFKAGDLIEITLKMHGTSQRTAHTLVREQKAYPYVIYRLRNLLGLQPKTTEKYEYISGTRRCTLANFDGGYYGSNAFRKQHHNKFVGKLHKGEEIFYEVVGFTDNGTPIMPSVSNSKLNDKEFVKKYGEETVFSYGCKPIVSIDCDDLQSDVYVYRMTITNPDGEVVEYTYDYMKYRCEQMGVKVVPLLTRFIIHDYDLEMDTRTAGEIVKDVAEQYYDDLDPIGKKHWREGVVVRIVNRPKFTAFKHKNFTFKVLEGIIKETATEADMEEAQETLSE